MKTRSRQSAPTWTAKWDTVENWIVFRREEYDAIPWPFSKTWEEFVAHPDPLEAACEDFGRASPCDGLGETPSVPARLPRPFPKGRYRMAVYHDAAFLYAFLESWDGPVIIPEEEIRRIPHLARTNTVYPALAILSADGAFRFWFGLDARGEAQGHVTPVVRGTREPETPKRSLDWRFHRRIEQGGDLVCWRISRESISEAFVGNTVRLSFSRMCLPTIEAVAWGSHTVWADRPDEMGTVRLVERMERPPWPKIRRVDFCYDPASERGRFRLIWDGPYRSDEGIGKCWPNCEADPRICALSVNSLKHILPLSGTVESADLEIPDGLNRIRIASAGGPAVAFDLEKCGGNRIQAPPWPAPPLVERRVILDHIRRDALEAIRAMEGRRARGEIMRFRRWAAAHAASCGRAVHYLGEDPRLLEVLRDEADFALTLQRPDGTYAGFHLQETAGRKPGPWAGGAYDTGPVGEMWVVAAWLLKDPKYLDAATRLLRAYRTYPIEFNHNYAAFALYHLAAHYRFTRDPRALEMGLYYCRHCAACDFLPLGFQGGHNYYSVYGAITLRGIAQFCQVLPDSEPYRATLRELCLRMSNQLITRLQPDGWFDMRDRHHLAQRRWLPGLFGVAFLLEGDDRRRLDEVFRCMLSAPDDGEDPRVWLTGSRLCESDFIRYFAHRDRWLAGETIDWATLM